MLRIKLYFTLIPKTKYIYEKQTEEGLERIEVYVTQETKEKMIKNHADYKGNKNPFYGKKHSNDSLRKIREHPNRKIFGKNETLSSVLALALSFLITYVFNRIQINFEDAFSFLGLDVLEFIAHPLLWIALLVITIFFLGVRNFFLLLGGLLIFASFFMYEKMFVAFVGIVFVLIGIWRIIRRKIKPSHSLGIIPIPFIPFPSYEETI